MQDFPQPEWQSLGGTACRASATVWGLTLKALAGEVVTG